MRSIIRLCLATLVGGFAWGCSSESDGDPSSNPADSGVDTGVDAGPDVETDVTEDATEDVVPDAVEEPGCTCPDDGDPCTLDACKGGQCTHDQAPEGFGCPTGRCYGGVCCEGCWDTASAACLDGTELAACGKQGSSCTDCDDGNPCTDDGCNLGACVHTPLDGEACPNGICDHGTCACGAMGEPCCAGAQPCSAAMAACDEGTCQPCFDDVTAGGNFTCLRRVDGTAWCWGSNSSGQLGNASNVMATTPTQVQTAETIEQIEAGRLHTCMVAGGQAYCWGENNYGRLGIGGTTDTNEPVVISSLSGVEHVSAGELHSCAQLASGSVFCWGYNYYGQLGDNSNTNSDVPVQTNLQDGSHVSAGVEHSCALRAGGALSCWGDNSVGAVGAASLLTDPFLSPEPVQDLGSGVLQVSTGWGHSCAVVDTGALYCWGGNTSGQLGDGTLTKRMTPRLISGVTGEIVDLSAGHLRTCAVSATSSAWCWGANIWGAAGAGTTMDEVLSPAKVMGLPASAKRIATGEWHSCAILADGTVWCWGANDYGQLGQGHSDYVLDGVPRKVTGLACQ